MDGQALFERIIQLFMSYWLCGLGFGLAIRILLMVLKI